MGWPKLLLPFGSSTILERCVDNLLNSRIDEIILVVGCRAEELIKKVAQKRVGIVVNPQQNGAPVTEISWGQSRLKSYDRPRYYQR